MITRLLAPNPGPMTLDGTNTYLVTRDGLTLVVDPGPADEGHLEYLAARTPSAVVTTHGHPDHTEGVPGLLARTGAARLDALTVEGRDALARFGAEVVPTPGHTADSVCLLLTDPEGAALLTGDTVLGRGPSIVDDLAAYLDSLALLRSLVFERSVVRLLPGHGPEVSDPLSHIDALIAHRQSRLEQVAAARAMGADTPEAVVDEVYPDLDPALRPAALASAAAQLAYLARTTH